MMKFKKTLAILLAMIAASAQLALPASAEELYGDINSDGAVDALDAACILQYAAYVGAGGKLDLKAFVNGEEERPPIGATDENDTLTILSVGNTELAQLVEFYQKENPDAKVEIRELHDYNGTGEGPDAFDDVLLSGEDIDLYLTEPYWVRSCIDTAGYALPLSAVGLTEEDYSAAYPFMVELGRNKDGELYGAAWDAAPGGFCYNTELAKEYLGVANAEEMHELVKDWDTFTETAAKLHKASEGGVTMVASLSDLWQCFSSQTTQPVTKEGKLNLDRARRFTDLAKLFIDNGYVDASVSKWDKEWYQVGSNAETLGYFLPTWTLIEGGTIKSISQDGNFAITAGPQDFYWGGNLFCIAPYCNSKTEAEKFLRFFTVNADTMEQYAKSSGSFMNNRTAMEEIIAEGKHKNTYLGGQDEFAVLHNVAENMDVKAEKISEWDAIFDETFFYQVFMQNHTRTTDEIVEMYAKEVLWNYGFEAADES